MKPLSRRQVSTLRHLKIHGSVSIESLRSFHQGTIWSLMYKGLVVKFGGSDVGLSTAGEAVLRDYNSTAPSYRKHDAELTDRVQRLLVRVKILQMRKSAAA
jgi:hypothetical protein